MWQGTRFIVLHAAIALLLFSTIPDLIAALRNVSVAIPMAVKRGDNAALICNYDIENDTLYTVKWYRGRREFYRYTPKENPAWKIFPSTNGIAVETSASNASHVLLRTVPLTVSGKFACEVSADAPSFHTSIVWAEMEVVEMPAQRPIITGIHSRYRLGDIINGNCSSDFSKPAANLTWWINDIQVLPNYIHPFEVQKHGAPEHLESAVLEINFVVTAQHFIKGRLKLKCMARIHDVYDQESEKLIEEDRPRILASGRSPDMNMYPFDQPTDADGFNDQNELYLTHYTNSAVKNPDNKNHLVICCQLMSLVLCSLLLPAISVILKQDTTTNCRTKTNDKPLTGNRNVCKYLENDDTHKPKNESVKKTKIEIHLCKTTANQR